MSLRKQLSPSTAETEEASKIKEGGKKKKESKPPSRRGSRTGTTLTQLKPRTSLFNNLEAKKITFIKPDKQLSKYLSEYLKYTLTDEESLIGDFEYNMDLVSVLSKKRRIIITSEAFYLCSVNLTDLEQRIPIQCIKSLHVISESKEIIVRCLNTILKSDHNKRYHDKQKILVALKGDSCEQMGTKLAEGYFLKAGAPCKNTLENHDRQLTKKNEESNKKHLEKYNKFITVVQKYLNNETMYGVFKVAIPMKNGEKAKRIIVVTIACLYFLRFRSAIVILCAVRHFNSSYFLFIYEFKNAKVQLKKLFYLQ